MLDKRHLLKWMLLIGLAISLSALKYVNDDDTPGIKYPNQFKILFQDTYKLE
jgi:hypothetical protein